MFLCLLIPSGEGLFGHDIVEVLEGDISVSVAISSVNHLLELRVVHGLAQFLGHLSQILERYDTCAARVEKFENFLMIRTELTSMSAFESLSLMRAVMRLRNS